MKLAGPDLILFVVGLLLFAGAGYGLIATGSDLGGGGGVLGLFQVTYPTETVQLEDQAITDLAGSHDVSFTVDAIDLTKVTVAVACGGPAADLPYALQVRVVGPNGLAGEASGGCGTSVTVPVSEVPPTTTVRGANEDEAHHNLGEHPNATRGQGTWTVTVSGSRPAGPVPLPGPGPSGTVSFSYERWTHEFTAVRPK